MMRVVAVSDLHGNLPLIPECELLLLGGDYCPTRGVEAERRFITGPFKQWLEMVPAKYKVGIAGNHDIIFQQEPNVATNLPWEYLQDQMIDIEGVKIYGTPWTPTFYNWAFMDSESGLKDRFVSIPEGLDILLTHGPAFKHLDLTALYSNVGSYSLLEAINRAKPDSVVCGHIHESRGIMQDGSTRYYNVTYVDRNMDPKFNPMSITLRAGS